MRPHSTNPVDDDHSGNLQTGELFVPNAWREPMQGILSAVAERCPVMLLVSADGRGKTTFLSCLEPATAVMATSTDVVVVAGVPPADWLERVAAAFDLTDADGGRDARIDRLRSRIAERAARGTQVVIAVDDAHRLPRSAMAEVLTFAGGWPHGRAYASVLLTGTSDLAERVAAAASLREAREFPRFSLAPWGIDDLGGFIRHRLARQTDGHQRFSHEAVARIHELSAGEPATVSRMVSRSLLLAQQSGETSVARITVDSAATSLATNTLATNTLATGTLATGTLDPGDPIAASRPLFPLPGRGGAAGVSGLAEGAAQPSLQGPSPPRRPGRGVHPAFPDPLMPRPDATPSRSYRRLIKAGAAAVALAIVGVALWSELQGPGRGSGRVVVLPAPTTVNQTAAAEADRQAAELPPTERPASSSVRGDEAAAPTAPVESAPLPTRAAPALSAPAQSDPPVSTTDAEPDPILGLADEGTAELMVRGDALMLLSDVSTARQFYLLAARRGDPAAYSAVAGTYDPVFLQTSGVRGVRGDAMQAIEWYRQAMRRGEPFARPRLVSLLAHLRATGEIDEAETQRLLDGRS